MNGVPVVKSQVPSTGLLRRLFPLPPTQYDAAANWVSYGSRTPRATRRASSVVLIRDSPNGVETYLGYRPGGSPLGSVAFPGGSLEAGDEEEIPWYGPSLSEWSKRLGILDQRLVRAQIVCAIRELFEETGVLLAGTDELSVVENCVSEDWMQIREAVAGQDKSFVSVLTKRGLGLRTDLLRPLSHWISPNFALRRFDTRYFAAALPVRQEPSLLQGKGGWAAWMVASDVLASRNSSSLGDTAGAPDTVGLPLSMITTPAVEVILEKIASTRGTVAYLSVRRELKSYHPDLVQVGDNFFLDVTTTTAAEGGGGGRGR
ncbi:NUDIX hydrolase [Paeniglutamicibacter sp. NPDC091659]|uniref:NUDIX hydrolase n=1 Tax=Paeniglutamicibacter sp. NPDC091659 TaxID=3364389 RepID=UPI0038086BB6